MEGYFDREGKPITDVTEWVRLFGDAEYKRVAYDELEDGRYTISTVWLGLNHQFGRGPPLIFETMTFGPDGAADCCRRYATLEEAKRGHEEMLRELKRQR
jgi:hypothetical protein